MGIDGIYYSQKRLPVPAFEFLVCLTHHVFIVIAQRRIIGDGFRQVAFVYYFFETHVFQELPQTIEIQAGPMYKKGLVAGFSSIWLKGLQRVDTRQVCP
jgi:hypothetical protein